MCSQSLQRWPPRQGLTMLAGGGPLERWAPGPSSCILAGSTPAACARARGSAPAGATTGGSWLRPVPLRVPAVACGPGWAGPWRLRYSWSHPQTWLPHASQPVFLSGRLHIASCLKILGPPAPIHFPATSARFVLFSVVELQVPERLEVQ